MMESAQLLVLSSCRLEGREAARCGLEQHVVGCLLGRQAGRPQDGQQGTGPHLVPLYSSCHGSYVTPPICRTDLSAPVGTCPHLSAPAAGGESLSVCPPERLPCRSGRETTRHGGEHQAGGSVGTEPAPGRSSSNAWRDGVVIGKGAR